jgi:phosphoserine aminotransferase
VRAFNFSSGPAVLPEPVLRRAQEAIWDLDGTGIGILEHSHRGAAFGEVLARAEALARRVAGIPDEYAILFMQGGATSQFFLVPANLLGGGVADYCDTGAWSQKAIKEARRYGSVHVACTKMEPPRWGERPVYAHFTSNETIHGVEWPEPPEPPAGVPLVCDASSDIFSRPIDVTRYGLLYAGAQKNLGPSGVTVVIARRDWLERGTKDLPQILQYRTFVADPMPNTPNTFGIFVIAEVLAWIEGEGGLAAMAARNAEKARLLYEYLDRSARFRAIVPEGARSIMNVVFTTGDEAMDRRFCDEAAARRLDGLAGHRSVGGMRASLYNAFPLAGVQALVAFMEEFEHAARPG